MALRLRLRPSRVRLLRLIRLWIRVRLLLLLRLARVVYLPRVVILTKAVLMVTMIGAVMDRSTAPMTVRRTQDLWGEYPVPKTALIPPSTIQR